MDVRDIMTREPATLGPSATCGEAATLMKQEDCGALPIVDAGSKLVGIRPDASVDDASKLMADRQIRRLPVVDDGRLVGIVVIGQLARRDDPKQTGETLDKIDRPSLGPVGLRPPACAPIKWFGPVAQR